MTDREDPPAPIADAPALAKVISMAARMAGRDGPKAKLELPAALDMFRKLTRPNSAVAGPANEVEVEIDPSWSELRAELEQDDIDAQLVTARRELAAGDQDYVVILAALRDLHAMRTFERGQHAEAFAEWEQLIEDSPHYRVEALLARSAFFAAEGDQRTAIHDLDRLAALEPRNAEVYERRARCFRRLDDWPRALADARRLVHLLPRNADALQSLGLAQRFTDDYEGGARTYGRAIQLAPWRADLYEERASCLMMTPRRAEEIADLTRCIERDPTNAEAFQRRAFAHARSREPERELADLLRAIELDPTHARWHHTLGRIRERQGQLDLAIEAFSRAIDLDPKPLFLEARARLHEAKGAADLAVADLLRAADIESNAPPEDD